MGDFASHNPDSRSLRKEHVSTEGYVRRQLIAIPVVASATRLKTAQATSASVVTTVTSFTAQPDVARILSVTPGGTTADVPAGDVTITGTNIRDEVITDVVTFAANASTKGVTLKAFKTVTSVVFPIQDGGSATYGIGVEDALGLDRCMTSDELILTTFNGAFESTRATVVYNASDVSKNTIDVNGTLNGAKDVVAVYVSKEIY